MSYRFSVAQLEQFVSSKKLSREHADMLLQHHYPETYAADLALTTQLLEDVREVKRLNRQGDDTGIPADILEIVAACFKEEATLDTPLSEKWMNEEEFDRVVYDIERTYDIEFDEDEPEEWVTIRDIANAVIELTED